MELKNDILLRALRRQKVEHTPIWIMRQAGRYLPEYREVRKRAGNFLTLCKTPELACEVTLQPLQRFDLDAAIIFSDILTIPDAMGLGLRFVEGSGPKFKHPLRDLRAIEKLPAIEVLKDLSYVMDAIKLTRRELNARIPLIGFSGSPWTLAAYMVEGAGSRDFRLAKQMLHAQPQTAHALLKKLERAVGDYLIAQAEAGAQALMLFDTWGGLLTAHDYQEFSLAYMKSIISRVNAASTVPVILFTKGGGNWLESIADSGCDCVGLDWTTPLADAKARIGARVALQGNLDPSVLYADDEKIKSEVKKLLGEYGGGSGHIFNLGHGITPFVKPERVATLVNAVHEFSAG